MASNPPSTEDVDVDYVVYMPFGEEASCIPITVKAGAKVKDLIKAIHEDILFKGHVESGDINLYRCEDLSEDSGNLYHKAVNWIRDHEETHRLSPSKLLKTHFPNRPAREEEVKVDVIAVTKSFFDIRCVVYVPYGAQAATYPFRVPKDATVRDLTRAICDDLQVNPHLDDTPLCLFKYGNPSIGTAKTRYQNILKWLQDHSESQMLDFADRLSKHFRSGPRLSDAEVIDVIVVTESMLEARDVLPGLPNILLPKFAEDQVSKIKKLPSPSESIKTVAGIKECTNEDDGIHGHRPVQNHGPPTALFHPALARLKHRLDHLDQEELEPSPHLLARCHSFIVRASEFHDNEKARADAMKDFLSEFFGEDISVDHTVDANKAIIDAVWGDLVRIILELKNEPGNGGDATLQAGVSFSKIVSQDRYLEYIKRSNCPAILIGLMGPRLEISTAIFTDGVYVDKLLSLDLILGAWKADNVQRVGRIINAIRLCAKELENYYKTLAHSLNPELTTAHLYPNPVPAEQGSNIPKLKFTSKLSRQGKPINIEESKVDKEERPYALYLANMEQADGATDCGERRNKTVVVKFTPRYNKEAHEVLAAHNLAPKLHFCAPVLGGLYMIVMDYVEGEPLYRASISDGYEGVYDRIQTAIDLLHEKNLVFGDLRAQNIISTPDGGVMLIDFDWASKETIGRYPATLSDHLETTWAKGIERGGPMEKVHDRLMFQKLKDFLEGSEGSNV